MSQSGLIILQGDPTTWTPPPAGKTAIGINLTGQIVTMQSNGTQALIVTSSPSSHAQANAAGTSTITIAQQIHAEIVTVSGTARTVPLVLDITGAATGARLTVLVKLPATAGLLIQLLNATVGGTLVDSFTSDGSIVSGNWEFYFDGAAWQLIRTQIPAY